MKVQKVSLSFPPSGSPDVVGYRLYLEEAAAPVGYQSQSWDIGNVTSIDLSTLDGMTTKDGTYNIGITAIDDAGKVGVFVVDADGEAMGHAAPSSPRAGRRPEARGSRPRRAGASGRGSLKAPETGAGRRPR